jgi:hypothetical protein
MAASATAPETINQSMYGLYRMISKIVCLFSRVVINDLSFYSVLEDF